MGITGRYQGAPGVGDTNPWPSPALWNQVDADANHPGKWWGTFMNSGDIKYNTEALPTTADPWNGMEVFTSADATVAQQDVDNASLLLTDATDNEAVVLCQGFSPFKIISGGGPLVFEARVKKTEITLASSLFVGLMQDVAPTVDIPINVADPPVPSAHNMVGFWGDEDEPATLDSVYKADDSAVGIAGADSVTLVADTWVKLGMVWDEEVLTWYANGLPLIGTLGALGAAGVTFPNDVRLGWVVAGKGGAASAVNVGLDWVRCYQKRVTNVA